MSAGGSFAMHPLDISRVGGRGEARSTSDGGVTAVQHVQNLQVQMEATDQLLGKLLQWTGEVNDLVPYRVHLARGGGWDSLSLDLAVLLGRSRGTIFWTNQMAFPELAGDGCNKVPCISHASTWASTPVYNIL